MLILGYTRTYWGGRKLALDKGYKFAYIVASNNAPIWSPRFCVMVK